MKEALKSLQAYHRRLKSRDVLTKEERLELVKGQQSNHARLERKLEIYHLWKEGLSLAEIGLRVGIKCRRQIAMHRDSGASFYAMAWVPIDKNGYYSSIMHQAERFVERQSVDKVRTTW